MTEPRIYEPRVSSATSESVAVALLVVGCAVFVLSAAVELGIATAYAWLSATR